MLYACWCQTLQRLQRSIFALGHLCGKFFANAALHECVKVHLNLFRQAEQVVAPNAQVLVVQATSGLQNAVILRQPRSLGEHRLKEVTARCFVKRSRPPSELGALAEEPDKQPHLQQGWQF